MSESAEILDRLYRLILSRKGGDPERSYTARLFAKGRPKIAQKLGEEAVETVIEAMRGDAEKTAAESADLLYFLLVLWAEMGIAPERVFRILAEREGQSGLDEKRSRNRN